MSPAHVLVLKPSSLGDIVHTLPAVAALRDTFPAARITWMLNPGWVSLFEENTDISDILIFPRDDFRGTGGWLRFLRWRAELKRRISPDLILDFQGLLRTGLVASAFWGTPAFGLSDAREGARFFHSKIIPVHDRMHAVERYLTLAAAAGATTGSPRFSLPQGHKPATALPSEPWLLLHPFSRGPEKSLPPEILETFCCEVGVPVVLVGQGGPASAQFPSNVTNLLGQTSLLELIWLLRHAAFVVSVDSGPMHLAAAVTENLLGIHSWSDPYLVGPYRPEAYVWKDGELFSARDPVSSNAGAKLPNKRDAATAALRVRELMAKK